MKTVTPNWYRGWNFSWNFNLISGPKLTINCGNCSNTFKQRVDVVNFPAVRCPFCGAINKLDLVVGEER
jgi:phage FluMu protein Com